MSVVGLLVALMGAFWVLMAINQYLSYSDLQVMYTPGLQLRLRYDLIYSLLTTAAGIAMVKGGVYVIHEA
jgi:hypothetical protein